MDEMFERMKSMNSLFWRLYIYNELDVVYRKRYESKSDFWRLLRDLKYKLEAYILWELALW